MPNINITKQSTSTQPNGMDDLIGNPPGWILQSGITLIAFVAAVILIATAFISYPDKINGKGMLSSTLPPIQHFSKTDGIIDSIYVTTGQKVHTSDTIAYISNLTNRNHLLEWEEFLKKFESVSHIPSYLEIIFPENLVLGELQNEYGKMQLTFSAFQATLRQGGVFEQIKTIGDEINQNSKLAQVLATDKNLSAEELSLIEKDHRRYESLLKDGVVSDLDKEKSKGELLRYQKQYNNTSQSIIQNKIRNSQLQSEIQRLTEERRAKINDHTIRMEESINMARQKIKDWADIYYIRAKTTGTAQIAEGIVKGKYLRPSDLLATVVYDGRYDQKYVLIRQAAEGFYRIDRGTVAVVRFDRWPYKEYGTLISQVMDVSSVPTPDAQGVMHYDVKLHLPDTIVTTYGMTIPYKPQATVIVDFITEDKSILHRIFDTFLNLIKN